MADGSVDSAKAEAARLKFTAIHDALIKAMANEQSLLEKAKDLKSQVEVSSSIPQPPPPACIPDLPFFLLCSDGNPSPSPPRQPPLHTHTPPGTKKQDQTEDAAIAAEPSEGDTEMQVAGLKEDLETAKAEVALCDEREQLQQLEVGPARPFCPR